jgi:hypothetical protein
VTAGSAVQAAHQASSGLIRNKDNQGLLLSAIQLRILRSRLGNPRGRPCGGDEDWWNCSLSSPQNLQHRTVADLGTGGPVWPDLEAFSPRGAKVGRRGAAYDFALNLCFSCGHLLDCTIPFASKL